LFFLFIKVFQFFTAELLMTTKIKVRTIVHSFELTPSDRELILDINSGLGIVGQFVGTMLMKAKFFAPKAVLDMPLKTPFFPFFKPIHIRAGTDEILHFHLFEFTGSKNKISRRDFVPKRFTDLRDSERNLLPHRLLNIQEIHEDPLRRFRSQINNRRRILE